MCEENDSERRQPKGKWEAHGTNQKGEVDIDEVAGMSMSAAQVALVTRRRPRHSTVTVWSILYYRPAGK